MIGIIERQVYKTHSVTFRLPNITPFSSSVCFCINTQHLNIKLQLWYSVNHEKKMFNKSKARTVSNTANDITWFKKSSSSTYRKKWRSIWAREVSLQTNYKILTSLFWGFFSNIGHPGGTNLVSSKKVIHLRSVFVKLWVFKHCPFDQLRIFNSRYISHY